MASAESNRKDPILSEYYQTMADVIGVYWCFQKERLKVNNLPFAFDKAGREKFDPQKALELHKSGDKPGFYDVIGDFSMGSRVSLIMSWAQFIKGCGRDSVLPVSNICEVPSDAKRFMDPSFMFPLLMKAEVLGMEATQLQIRGGFTVAGAVAIGVVTGPDSVPHMSALFGDDFKSAYPLMVSKLKFGNAYQALAAVGKSTSASDIPSYKLLHPVNGLNRTMLKDWGLGDSIGCPAGMKISARTRSFLEKDCRTTIEDTMLDEYSVMGHHEFKATVRDWYNKLGPDEKTLYIDWQTRELLDGVIWGSVKTSGYNRCPYNGN